MQSASAPGMALKSPGRAGIQDSAQLIVVNLLVHVLDAVEIDRHAVPH